MKSIHLEIGSIVRDYRGKKKLTQIELAIKLGYSSPQFVSLFERGLSKIPVETLGQLVVILGIPEKKIVNILLNAYEQELRGQIDHGKKVANN